MVMSAVLSEGFEVIGLWDKVSLRAPNLTTSLLTYIWHANLEDYTAISASRSEEE
jgi:hypothetical protein